MRATEFFDVQQQKPKAAPQPCPDWLGFAWRVVAVRRANPVTDRDYWAWTVDAIEQEKLLKARDSGNATTINRKEDGVWVLEAIRLH